MISGVANLPLHNGKAPAWLFKRMRKLAVGIAELIVDEFGAEYFLKLLSDPFWFQSLGCVVGFDWHSSGLTTTLTGALRDINKLNLGVKMAGGKGMAQKVPEQIEKEADALGLSDKRVENLKYSSKMSAKVDSSLLQDGFSLYHHTIFFTKKSWVVVQQGKDNAYARRYHLISEGIKSFVLDPNNAIASQVLKEDVLDMSSKCNLKIQETSLDLVKDNPKHIYKYFSSNRQRTLDEFSKVKELTMPKRHYLTSLELTEQVKRSLEMAYEYQPRTYEELVALKGFGKKSIRALALVSELIYGSPIHWKDPAKYSFAHGGKDGIPYPVDRKLYDETNKFICDAIKGLRIDDKTKTFALKRLSNISRFSEQRFYPKVF